MEKLNKSLNELINLLKLKKELSSLEWDEYAKNNTLYSSVTIEAHINVRNWEELKIKLLDNTNPKNINKEIEALKKQLNNIIEKYGLNSVQIKDISIKINNLINEYYKNNRSKTKGRIFKNNNNINENYNKSYEHMKSLTMDLAEFPTIKDWNNYAKYNNCLNSESMQYISRIQLA